jgi:hypothetical protein
MVEAVYRCFIIFLLHGIFVLVPYMPCCRISAFICADVCTVLATELEKSRLFHRRNCIGKIWVQSAYGRNFFQRTPVDGARKATHRSYIGGIDCCPHVLIFIANLGLAPLRNLDAPPHYKLAICWQPAPRIAVVRTTKKHPIGNAVWSRLWPFELTDNAFQCVFSQEPVKLAINIFDLWNGGLLYRTSYSVIHDERWAFSFLIIKISLNVPTRCIRQYRLHCVKIWSSLRSWPWLYCTVCM